MKARNLFFIFFSLVIVNALPVRAMASVQITEIMYDVSGSDSGREWVEIVNLGPGAVDASAFKFFEANTNHALTLVSGSAVLQPQVSAVIVEDEVKFLVDWPSFHGAVFKSSFSLSNTGESVAIKDATLSVLDSVTYDSSMGAAGDGNSLRRSGIMFVAGAPDPGVFVENSNESQEESASDSSVSTTNSSIQPPPTPLGVGGALPISAHISGETMVMVGGGSYFSGTAFGTQGLPLQNARYVWNFGDGATGEGQTVFHTYSYPGKYAVSLDASSGFSTGTDRAVVEAVGAHVALEAQADGSLAVFNKSKKDIDIGLWTLASLHGSFVIPKNTILLAGEGVRFSPSITKFFGDTDAKLLYPNEAVAVSADPSADSPLRGEPIVAPSVPASVVYPKASPSPAPVSSAAASPTPLREFGAEPSTNAAAPAESGTSMPFWAGVLGLAGLLLVGIAGVWYVRSHSPVASESSRETAFDEGEFELE